ncbi:sucrase ferredoxin [Nocardioides coralli]|uniref:sucrase ferredoxin n=1 Tax=Nocardioides coralli TaxID=2872154 RepID=UPI001CA4365C|nr:sucrase ferredoxin [Nocardioides coralli]QZY28904.1 hypothetical protein K6T13_15885 [Nocardioides coralli]
MTDSFRCALASGLRGDDQAGTASTVRAFLLVENPGPWGLDAVRDNRMPEAVKRPLADAARAAGVRINLVRRHRRAAPRHGFRVFAAYAHPHRPWLETTQLEDAEQLLDLDLAALGAGRSTGLEVTADPVLGVCTHGRHDACCAERGRPVAAALAAAHPDLAWEISHIGGDRFAGNALFLPHGLYYGRLDAVSAVAVAGSHLSGEVDLDHLRGRSGYPMPVQAAEIALRRQLGETRLDAVRLRSRRRGEDGVLHVVFDVGGVGWQLAVRTSHGGPQQLTCRAARTSPVPRHEVIDVRRLP